MRISDAARCSLRIVAAMSLLSGCSGNGGGVAGLPTSAGNAAAHMQTFKYDGHRQTFKVPAGVRSLSVVGHGAAGAGIHAKGSGGGLGGRVHATLPVTPGETLYVYVGGAGSDQAGGFDGGADGGVVCVSGSSSCNNTNGFGGGGASDIRQGGTGLRDRIFVVGGGGGQGASGYPISQCDGSSDGTGGKGGATTGGDGALGCQYGGNGGSGGSQTGGGSGGTGFYGTAGAGGKGSGGGGSAGGIYSGGGGGGGGYYGGGGGGAAGVWCGKRKCGVAGGGGGGGGSSYAEPSATHVQMWQGWHKSTGDGLIVLSW